MMVLCCLAGGVVGGPAVWGVSGGVEEYQLRSVGGAAVVVGELDAGCLVDEGAVGLLGPELAGFAFAGPQDDGGVVGGAGVLGDQAVV